jgi:hypothetical protein
MAKTKLNLKAIQKRMEERIYKAEKKNKNKIGIYIPKPLTQTERDIIEYGIKRIEKSRKFKSWAKNKGVKNGL